MIKRQLSPALTKKLEARIREDRLRRAIKGDADLKRILNDPNKAVTQNMDQLRSIIAYWKVYPDKMIDWFARGTNFNLYFSQRVFLRVVLRHRYVYATFPRGFAKSFLTVLAEICRAILYPGSDLFVTTGGGSVIVVSHQDY